MFSSSYVSILKIVYKIKKKTCYYWMILVRYIAIIYKNWNCYLKTNIPTAINTAYTNNINKI